MDVVAARSSTSSGQVDDRDAAVAVIDRLGGRRLPKGGSSQVWSDPAGHPLCLCRTGE